MILVMTQLWLIAGGQNGVVVSIEVVSGTSLEQAAVLGLYESVDWGAYTRDPDRLLRAISGSTTVVAAREAGELVGLARVVSDGASIAYLQDVLVRPVLQRTGLGRRLVEAALQPYVDVRQKVLLTDDEPAQRAFYESLGFSEVRDFGEGTLRSFVRFD
jgi:GNAT superfamily N-acetyltransferase